jgi:hypothetical protein
LWRRYRLVAGKLTDEQIQAVAYYVSRATGGGKE